MISDAAIAQLDDTFGFAYMSSKKTGLAKDFIGFEDGNDNPQGYTARVCCNVKIHIVFYYAFLYRQVLRL